MMKINEHVTLLPLVVEDAPALFECIAQNRHMLATYLYWVDKVIDVKSTVEYIDERANSQQPNRQWFKVILNGDICGVFAIKSIDKNGIAELGYWLSKHAQGQNIIPSIVKRLLDERKNWAFNCVEFRCLTSNFASIGVAKKVGAKKEGTLANFLTIGGRQQDLDIYRIRF